ncbi:MAG: hypothetical protein ACK4JE_00505 [Endomicrobiia bacterium]
MHNLIIGLTEYVIKQTGKILLIDTSAIWPENIKKRKSYVSSYTKRKSRL